MKKYEATALLVKAINACLDAGIKPSQLVYSVSDTLFDERERWHESCRELPADLVGIAARELRNNKM